MKKRDRNTWHDAGPSELTKRLVELESSLASQMVNRYTKPSKNTREVRTIRHTIAVLKTLLREKEITHG